MVFSSRRATTTSCHHSYSGSAMENFNFPIIQSRWCISSEVLRPPVSQLIIPRREMEKEKTATSKHIRKRAKAICLMTSRRLGFMLFENHESGEFLSPAAWGNQKSWKRLGARRQEWRLWLLEEGHLPNQKGASPKSKTSQAPIPGRIKQEKVLIPSSPTEIKV